MAAAALLGIALAAPDSSWAGGKLYGSPIDKARGQAVEIDSLYADSAKYVGKNVIVEGKAGQVCQASGCWLMLTDGGSNQLYVQFYDFTVRMGTGTRLRVQGELRTQNKVPYLVAEGLEVVK
jgi:hypothetical protein